MERIQDYRVLKVLGRGSFATVYLAVRQGDPTKVALKKISLKGAPEKDKKNALNEVRLLSSINSQYVIGFHSAFYEPTTEELYMVMEYAGKQWNKVERGDLAQKIQRYVKSDERIPESEIWTILEHTAKGLSYLHSSGILHRDLKTANVFQTGTGVYKIADFNVSKFVEKEGGLAETQIGTPYYASPQVWENSKYDSKADIWSLGVLAYELASLKMPFPAKTVNELYAKINKGKFNRIPSIYSEGLSILISDMLNPDPVKRPSSEAIVACAVLNKFEVPSLTIKPLNRRKMPHPSIIEQTLDPELSNKSMREQKDGRERLSSMRGPIKSERKGISLMLGKENEDSSIFKERKGNEKNVSRLSNRTERIAAEEKGRRMSERKGVASRYI